jgi:hypothetical protein
MRLQLKEGLPYTSISLTYRGQQITFDDILIDTGSGGTIFATDKVLAVDLRMESDDVIERIRGVGGTEFVFTKRVDLLALGELQAADFEIEVGAMAYGFELDGILGMDFLLQVGAVIDLARLEIYPAPQTD